MIRLKFNTATHYIKITTNGEYIGLGLPTEYHSVKTIKINEMHYKIIQELSTGKPAPVLRLPISSTIIEYIHE